MRNVSGFTIVELLIVIVVIGVLASISVTAYSGVQERSRSATMVGAVDTVQKALLIYAQKNQGLPNPTEVTGGGATVTYACVQPTSGGWPVQDNLSASQCMSGSGIVSGYSTILRDAILESVSKIPNTADITLSVGSQGTRGLMYMYHNPAYADLVYYVRGDQVCGRGEKLTYDYNGSQLTYCSTRVIYQG